MSPEWTSRWEGPGHRTHRQELGIGTPSERHLNGKGKPLQDSKQESDVLISTLFKDLSGALLEDASGGREAGEQGGGWCRRKEER